MSLCSVLWVRFSAPIATLEPPYAGLVAGRWCARLTPLENFRASTSIFVLQATKSQRWMPWRLKPMKDVGDCEKLRGAVDQALIRRYPNGETRHP